ncbi:cytochrome P450 [Gordonia sp. CPCC 206044]|uniref:cytochrome P450 n=1 Tax=Gordonia sp. CPCC 206044 TaxID=3140793 RepID=UPI003AF40A76
MHDLDDPYTYYASLRTHSPVARLGDSGFYAVASWELIQDVVARPEEFSSNLTATMVWHPDGTITDFPIAELGAPLHVLATADGPTHRLHRKLVMPSLVPGRIRELEQFIVATLADLWGDGLRDGHIDWVTAIAQRLPMAVVAELLGLDAYDIDDLLRWAFASTMVMDAVVTPGQLDDAGRAVAELTAHLDAALAGAMDAPGDDVMGVLAGHVGTGVIDRTTALVLLIQLVAAGAESTVSLLGTAVRLLGSHPEIESRLRADRALVPVFVEEALRLESPFRGHYRHVTTDTVLGDTQIPAGARLYLLWGSANRDDGRFDNPDAISLDTSTRPTHMAFGKGIHLCVGAALARMEARIAIDFLLDATTGFDIVGDPQWERSLLVRRLRSLGLVVR